MFKRLLKKKSSNNLVAEAESTTESPSSSVTKHFTNTLRHASFTTSPNTTYGEVSPKRRSPRNDLASSNHSPRVNPREYDFCFESLFDTHDCRQLFTQYLTSTYNRDPLDFMTQVEAYLIKKSAKNRYDHATEIIETYLQPNSTCEINVGNADRRELLELYTTKCSPDYCPKDLFEKMYTTIFIELKSDCFPKFIDSEMFRQFLSIKLQMEGYEFLDMVAKKKLKHGETQILSREGDVPPSLSVPVSDSIVETSIISN